jgi:hypothetical protein
VNHQLQAEIVKLGGDPSDATWYWFVINGPHGSNFNWAPTRNEPAGYVALEHLREIVAARAEADAEFVLRVRDVIKRALASNDMQLVRRAIQVAAVVGGSVELDRIAALVHSSDQNVAADARACVFVLSRAVRDP